MHCVWNMTRVCVFVVSVFAGLLATVGEATARIFHWCAAVGVAPAGVNAPDGSGVTVLHRLAASGLTDAVQAYVQSAGPALDWSLRDSSGLTALDVARYTHTHTHSHPPLPRFAWALAACELACKLTLSCSLDGALRCVCVCVCVCVVCLVG